MHYRKMIELGIIYQDPFSISFSAITCYLNWFGQLFLKKKNDNNTKVVAIPIFKGHILVHAGFVPLMSYMLAKRFYHRVIRAVAHGIG